MKRSGLYFLVPLLVLLAILVGVSCSDKPTDTGGNPGLTLPPAIGDLQIMDSTSGSVTLMWTALAADDIAGAVAEYDIRYLTRQVTDANWSYATQCTTEPTPGAPGTIDSCVITGLDDHQEYCFAMRLRCEKAEQWSPLSNNCHTCTPRVDRHWHALGSGFKSWVWAVTEYNGQLYAGGDLATSWHDIAEGIAVWDGNSWSSLGLEATSGVDALVVYDGKLIVSGTLVLPGTSDTVRIAAWDGSSWSTLGGGLNSSARLAVHNGKLIAAGHSPLIGSSPGVSVAIWDGRSWSSVESDISGGYISSLAVYGGNLIVAGEFTSAGSAAARNIAAWNGTSWSALGSGTGGRIFSLAVFRDKLVASGDFSTAGGVEANHVAAWDGNEWESTGIDGPAIGPWLVTLTVFDDMLIAGGIFAPDGNLLSWDGDSWSQVGRGVDIGIMALCTYDGGLVAAGTFSLAFDEVGTIEANNIALWSE